MSKEREQAKEFFDEELSGEPLHEDVVIDALIEYTKVHRASIKILEKQNKKYGDLINAIEEQIRITKTEIV